MWRITVEVNSMDEMEELKARVKKLNAQATQLKMDLHDLSEDLPTGWEKIPEVAKRTFEVYQALTEA
ncbi:MAG: CCE_0567 family metalloprotein, partial [Sulfuricella sp.]